MPFIDPEALRQTITQAYLAVGLLPEDAALCARWMVSADMAGVSTHGTVRLALYLDAIEQGKMNSRPNITVAYPRPGVALVDGDHGLGVLVGTRAMAEAVKAAKVNGIGVAVAKRSSHYGRAGFFLETALEAGCVGVSVSNGAPVMTTYGGSQAVICTNPIAAATPSAPGRTAFAMDMAQSVGAFGKIRHHEREGTPIPEGWALTAEGKPTTVPEEAIKGALIPFGGAKGSALALLVEVLAGVLSGADFGTNVANPTRQSARRSNTGHLFMAFDVEAFMPLGDFTERVDLLSRMITGARPAEGFDEVRFPGQGASERRKAVDKHGIEMPASALTAIAAALAKRGLPMVAVRE